MYNADGDVNILAVDCGMKTNQIRCLCSRGARVTVVPWDHVFDTSKYDGLFLSNGPGDPTICDVTVQNLKSLLTGDTVKPIFGICLGHQLLSVASGAKTFKMKLVYIYIYKANLF